MEESQRLPRKGDQVSWDGWLFEVQSMDGRRVDKVLIKHSEGKKENE